MIRYVVMKIYRGRCLVCALGKHSREMTTSSTTSVRKSNLAAPTKRILLLDFFAAGLRLAFKGVWDTFCVSKTMTCDL